MIHFRDGNQTVKVNQAQKDYLDQVLSWGFSRQFIIYDAYDDFFRGDKDRVPFDLNNTVDGDTFNRAVWFGYELEEEPLYYIELAPGVYVNVLAGEVIHFGTNYEVEPFKTKFTESEIEELDPRWLAFKVKVGADDE